MEVYAALFALLEKSEIFDKQYALYCALEKESAMLPELSLMDFAMERISACELWYPDFRQKDAKDQLRGLLHQGLFSILIANEKCIWRL